MGASPLPASLQQVAPIPLYKEILSASGCKHMSFRDKGSHYCSSSPLSCSPKAERAPGPSSSIIHPSGGRPRGPSISISTPVFPCTLTWLFLEGDPFSSLLLPTSPARLRRVDPPDCGGHHLCDRPGFSAAYQVSPPPQQTGERRGLPDMRGLGCRCGGGKKNVRQTGVFMPSKQSPSKSTLDFLMVLDFIFRIHPSIIYTE